MYLLTIRDGLQTRHIGPYESPARAAADLEALLGPSRERARWWIHELESPSCTGLNGEPEGRSDRPAAMAA
jgi:hypothetical protein